MVYLPAIHRDIYNSGDILASLRFSNIKTRILSTDCIIIDLPPPDWKPAPLVELHNRPAKIAPNSQRCGFGS
jgi:hypothetical protein